MLVTVLEDVKSGFACGEDLSEGVFQVRMNNVTAEGGIDLTKKRRVPVDMPKLQTFLVEPGDVLFNATNSPELVGKSAFFPGLGERVVFSNHFLRLRPRPTDLDGRFLARWLTFQYRRRLFEGMCKKWVNQATVGRETLLALPIPIPPLMEQLRIADILDRADALRAKRRDAIGRWTRLGTSIFYDIFGDPFRNPQGWPSASLGACATQVTDGEHLTPERTSAGIKLLSARNVRDGYLDFENVDFIGAAEYERIRRRCEPTRGDVLISCSGSIGRIAPVETDEPFALVRSAALVRPDQSVLRTPFLHYMLRTPAVQAQMARSVNASSQANLFQRQIRELSILRPPLELQDKFAERIAVVEQEWARQRGSLARLEGLFASLQQFAFRGAL